MKVQIYKKDFSPKSTKILIDGQEISNDAIEVNVNLKSGCVPEVKLTIIPKELEIEGEFDVMKNIRTDNESSKNNITLNINTPADVEKVAEEFAKKLKDSIKCRACR